MENQKNFMTAVMLSGLVMLGYWFFFGKPFAEQAQRDALARQQAQQQTQAQNLTVDTPRIELKSRDAAVSEGVRIPIETASLQGSFSLAGFRVDDITLKDYKATLEKDSGDLVLLTPEAAEKSAYVFDNWVKADGGSGLNTVWQLVKGSKLTETTPIITEAQGDGFIVTRTISIDDKYLITLDDTLVNTSGGEINIQRKGASRQHGLPDDLTNFFILQEGPIAIVDDTLKKIKYKKLSKKRSTLEIGESGWVGLTDKYWLAAAIAPQDKPMTARFNFRQIDERDVYESAYELDPITLSAGRTLESKAFIYAGAKRRKILESYEKDLDIARMDLAIDWGALGILTRPMSLAITWLGERIGNYGLAIMALTLLIKIVLFPLFNKQYESQAKMKKLAPQLKKIQTRYKDDRLKLQQEMMALYKKEGANPMAGCLPIIPTIFVFFALYKSVFINVDLRHAPFYGWIKDLSAPDPLSILNGFGVLPWDPVPIAILGFFAIGPLAILYGVTMALMYTLTPQTAGGGEQAEMMAKMMKFMPWIFMFILAPFATGLLVYWVWNNVLSFAQQYYITRKFKVDTPVDAFFRKISGRGEKAPAE